MSLHQFGIKIQNGRYRFIADGVRAQLQSSSIGIHHAVTHQSNRVHLVGEQPAIIPLVQEWLKKISGSGTQGTIGVGFQSTNSEVRISKGMADPYFYLI